MVVGLFGELPRSGVKRRAFGRTGLDVSEISLGTVELGLNYGIAFEGDHLCPSPDEAARVLADALDRGVNFIDTAPAYGESEAIIGRALAGRRAEFILATKVAGGHGLERAQALERRVRESVHASLRALRTDAIDLLQIHSASEEVIRRGELLDLLLEMRRQGLLRFVGATTYDLAASRAVIADGRFDCLQVPYNLLDRRPEREVLRWAGRAGLAIVARSVLLKGALTHRWTALPDALGELRAAAQKLEAVASAARATLPEVAYRWVLMHPAVSTALVGTARRSELEAAVSYALAGPLSHEMTERLSEIVVADEEQLNPGRWPVLEGSTGE